MFRAIFWPPGASFGLIFGLHQDFMIIQRAKYGFWDILIFRPVFRRQSPIFAQKLKKWGGKRHLTSPYGLKNENILKPILGPLETHKILVQTKN